MNRRPHNGLPHTASQVFGDVSRKSCQQQDSHQRTRQRLRRGRRGGIWALMAVFSLCLAWDAASRLDATTYERLASTKLGDVAMQ
jgi:hypothetical protein